MKQLDLNLLRVFCVLLDKRNTRLAAQELCISQPAVSKALGRLRDYFQDELFTRVYSGLEPTPRALELGDEIPALLNSLDNAVIGKQVFDPAEYKGQITVAMNGFIANWLGSALSKEIVTQAPNAQVNIVNWESNTLERVQTGDIQAAINYSPLETSKQFVQKSVGSDNFVGLVRAGHPIQEKMMTEDEVKVSKFASLVVPGWNESLALVARYFEERGISPNIQVRSSYLHMLLDLLRESDLILPCSSNLANSLKPEFSPVYFPIETPQELRNVVLVTSHNKRRHPLHLWVNKTLENLLKQTK